MALAQLAGTEGAIITGPLVPIRGDLTIGRSHLNGICLTDPHVSERHAVVTAAADEVWLRDVGSEHGTFVNGRKVCRALLHRGDLVEIGNSVFEVRSLVEVGPALSAPAAAMQPLDPGPGVLVGPSLRAQLFGASARGPWFTMEGLLRRLSSYRPLRSLFVCTSSCSPGALAAIALGHLLDERSPEIDTLRIIIGDPGPDAERFARLLVTRRRLDAPEAVRHSIRTPRLDGGVPPVHAKLMLLALSSGHHVAVVGSSNASFSGYVENWELNIALVWRFGDPYGLSATAARLWDCSETLRISSSEEASAPRGKIRPHEWQRSRIKALRAVWQSVARGEPRPVRELSGYTLEMPPGTGKTLVAVEFLRAVLASEGRVLWLAHRRALLSQAASTIERQLGSCQALRQLDRSMCDFEPPCVCLATDAMLASQLARVTRHTFDAVIVDEAHRYGAARYAGIFQRLRARLLVGLSATPARRGRGRARSEFEARFPRSQVLERLPIGVAFRLRDKGRPVLARVRHVSFDTGWVMRVPADDPWSLETAERRQLKDFAKHFTPVVLAVLEAVVTRYATELGPLGPTLVFATDIAHAGQLERGISTMVAAMDLPMWIRQFHSRIPVRVRRQTRSSALELLREEFLSRARAGETPILIGVDIVAEGFDLPPVQTLVLSRPTVSLRLYAQMMGRGLRGPAMVGTDYCNLIHFGAQTEIGGQRQRVFADVRDVLTRDLDRVQRLTRLEDLLRRDESIARCRAGAQLALAKTQAHRR